MILSLPVALLGLQLTSAVPFVQVTDYVQGADIAYVAIDERDRHYIAYRSDGSPHSRFPVDIEPREELTYSKREDPTSCNPMTTDDVQKLPGWAKIYKEATASFGKNPKIVTNNLNLQARACVDPKPVPLPLGSATCTTDVGKVDGFMSGTNGWVSIGYSEDFSTTSSWTITNTAAFAIAGTFTTEFIFNAKLFNVEVDNKLTVTGTFTNTQSHSFDTKIDAISTQSLQVNNGKNQRCTGTFQSKTCTRGGKGRIPIIADGWVWFFYDKPVKSHGKGSAHYKWALNMATILPNSIDRTSYIEFVGSLTGTTHSGYSGGCKS